MALLHECDNGHKVRVDWNCNEEDLYWSCNEEDGSTSRSRSCRRRGAHKSLCGESFWLLCLPTAPEPEAAAAPAPPDAPSADGGGAASPLNPSGRGERRPAAANLPARPPGAGSARPESGATSPANRNPRPQAGPPALPHHEV